MISNHHCSCCLALLPGQGCAFVTDSCNSFVTYPYLCNVIASQGCTFDRGAKVCPALCVTSLPPLRHPPWLLYMYHGNMCAHKLKYCQCIISGQIQPFYLMFLHIVGKLPITILVNGKEKNECNMFINTRFGLLITTPLHE